MTLTIIAVAVVGFVAYVSYQISIAPEMDDEGRIINK